MGEWMMVNGQQSDKYISGWIDRCMNKLNGQVEWMDGQIVVLVNKENVGF